MTEFSERLSLDLTDAFPGDVEFTSDFLQGTGPAVFKAETEFQDLFFAGCKRRQYLLELLLQKSIRINCALLSLFLLKGNAGRTTKKRDFLPE